MAAILPPIDQRDSETIRQQAQGLARFYTPEWDAAAENDAGAALLTVFAQMLEGLAQRLNQVPRNNFIEFLNTLDVKLLPAQPARAPLTFLMSTGAQEGVEIPARTQATAAPADGGEPLVFETEKAIFATPAQLPAVFSIVPAQDQIFDHSKDHKNKAPFELFAVQNGNIQEHSLYLGHGDLFNAKGPVSIELTVDGSPPDRRLFDTGLITWQYVCGEREEKQNGETSKIPEWCDFSIQPAENGTYVLQKEKGDEIIKCKIDGVESRWIRCTVKSITTSFSAAPIKEVADVSVKQMGARVRPLAMSGAKPDMAFYNDTEIDLAKPFYPFGTRPRLFDTFYLASQDAFSKKGAPIKLNFEPCAVMICAPKLRSGHVQGVSVTPASASAPATGVYQLAVKTMNGSTTLPLNDVAGLAAGAILKIDDPNREEFLIIESISTMTVTTTVTTTLPLLYDHDLDTLVYAVTVTEAPSSTQLTQAVKEMDLCLPVAHANVFWDFFESRPPEQIQLAKIGDGKSAEYHIICFSKPSAMLSWEYWDGNGWRVIAGLDDQTAKLMRWGNIAFVCPDDIKTLMVNGQEKYWIRARITSGDYGKEEFEIQPGTNKVISQLNFCPPCVNSLTVNYTPNATFPDVCKTYNNRAYEDRTEQNKSSDKEFSPFVPMDEKQQALFLGFDRQLQKGPISIFFSLEEQQYTEKNLPRIEWYYYRQLAGNLAGEWARLEVPEEETKNLTQGGTLQFMVPADFCQSNRFGQTLFWLTAVDVDSKFKPSVQPPLRSASSGKFGGPPTLSQTANSIPRAPRVRGIYPNTAWAIQAETIRDEILSLGARRADTATAAQASETIRDGNLSSRTGALDRTVTLAKFPVREEQIKIWINELGTLSESERSALRQNKAFDVQEEPDEQGKATAFWVCWQAVEDLSEKSPKDRVYAIDSTFGEITFGDGQNGMKVPIGRNNIRATYQAGGGARGNVGVQQITALRTTIPSVEEVSNPEAAGGAADTESVERALERGPQKIKHRGRAVTVEDYAWLAKEASRSIVRVKVLPNMNDQGQTETNWVTIIIVPASPDPRPTPTPQLRQNVERYLRTRAANAVSSADHILVVGPTYVAVDVTAELFAKSIDWAPQIEARAMRCLQDFLHPLTGDFTGRGWEFGRLPYLSDIYKLLEDLEDVDHVGRVEIVLQAFASTGPIGKKATSDITKAKDNGYVPYPSDLSEYSLIFSGTHSITLNVSR